MKNLSGIILLLLILTTTACRSQKAQKQNFTMDKLTTLTHPEWSKKSNIYEVNIRQYTKEGTFKAFQPHIQRLKNMGVDIIWLMPINPIGEKNRKGSLGSYYAVKDYKVINAEYGTLADFKDLVTEAHSLNMHVIIDWVANHTAWDNNWVEEHPEWYKKDSLGNFASPYDWTDVLALDYSNHQLWKGMADAMKYWLDEADIDGFRCDVAMLVSTDFWDSARAELDKTKAVFMLAEAEQPNHHLKAFDANYSWEMFHVMQKVAKGENKVNDIYKERLKEDGLFSKSTYQMLFTSNHDENSWNGTEYEMFGEATKTFSILNFVMPGFPLIYNGQEAGLNRRLKFFEKDEIDWKNLSKEDFYKSLIELKNRNSALWNGEFGGDFTKLENNNPSNIFSFLRKLDGNTVLILCNLSAKNFMTEINFAGYEGSYINSFTGEKVEIKMKNNFDLKPWQYIVMEKH